MNVLKDRARSLCRGDTDCANGVDAASAQAVSYHRRRNQKSMLPPELVPFISDALKRTVENVVRSVESSLSEHYNDHHDQSSYSSEDLF